MWEYWVPLGVAIATAAVAVGVIKQNVKNNCKEIEILRSETQDQETRLVKLEGKIWSQEDLKNMIKEAVEQALTHIENKWLKDGLLHKHS